MPAVGKVVVRGAVDLYICRVDSPQLVVIAKSRDTVASVEASRVSRKRAAGDKLVIDRPGCDASTVSAGPLGGITMIATGNHTVQISHVGGGSVTVLDDRRRAGTARREALEQAIVVLALPEVPHLAHQGSGLVTLLDVQQGALGASVEGVGSILAFGSVQSLEVAAAGNGKVLAGRLDAQDVALTAEGTSRIVAHATESARARVSGIGSVEVRGDPKRRDQKASGMGTIVFA